MTGILKSSILAAGLAVLAASTAFAQGGLRPLDEEIATAAPEYPLERCAGLFISILQLVGPDADPELRLTYQSAATDLVSGAIILVMAGQAMDEAAANQTVETNVSSHAVTYLDRMAADMASDGDPIEADALMQFDLEVCASTTRLTRELLGAQ